MGRLAGGPHPLLRDLLYAPGLAADRRDVLPHLLRIDAAHVVMLARQGLLPEPAARRLLAANRGLWRRHRAGEDVLGAPEVHRGLYMLYEGALAEAAGAEAAAAVHLARSRNDINATVTRMRLREELVSLLPELAALLRGETALARRHAATPMCAFTHSQPAQPSTFGHWLAGTACELLRAAEGLAARWDEVNRSPMGAAAGFGTSFPIDRELVASLLAFDGAVASSLDAVASRDYLVRVLAEAALAGVALTRQTVDLQAWAGHAYGFVDWPDELVSTSSIMPQKRNAYVLETIRGRAVTPSGALAATLAALKGTPFTNSVEVSGEAPAHLWPALERLAVAVRLMALLVAELRVRPERMRAFLAGAGTTMTAVADLLVRHGLPFRQAHDAVGRLVAERPDAGEAPAGEVAAALSTAVAAVAGRAVEVPVDELAAALDPEAVARAARYGGGPAPETVRELLDDLDERIGRLEGELDGWRRRLARLDDDLDEAAAPWLA